MENIAIENRVTRPILIGLMLTLVLALAGCGGDSGPEYDPNCPLCEPEDFQDHILHSCVIYYTWNGISNSWTSCDNAWTPVENQPVFTNLSDCLIAKGHLHPICWSGGVSRPQASTAIGHRVWKTQPFGGFIGLGTSPPRT